MRCRASFTTSCTTALARWRIEACRTQSFHAVGGLAWGTRRAWPTSMVLPRASVATSYWAASRPPARRSARRRRHFVRKTGMSSWSSAGTSPRALVTSMVAARDCETSMAAARTTAPARTAWTVAVLRFLRLGHSLTASAFRLVVRTLLPLSALRRSSQPPYPPSPPHPEALRDRICMNFAGREGALGLALSALFFCESTYLHWCTQCWERIIVLWVPPIGMSCSCSCRAWRACEVARVIFPSFCDWRRCCLCGVSRLRRSD